MKSNIRIGSAFDDFLKSDGIYEEVTTMAIQRGVDWQCQQGHLIDEGHRAENKPKKFARASTEVPG
jgi:hypothetical protein